MLADPKPSRPQKSLIKELIRGDKTLWIVFFFLTAISIIEVYSASSMLAYKSSEYWVPFRKHLQMLLMGWGAAIVIHHIPTKWLSVGSALLPVSILLLIATLFWGKEINGSYRWIELFGFRFQPSEIAKLACVIFTASWLSNKKKYTHRQIFTIILIGIIPVCSLIFPENLSTSVIIYLFAFLMMYIGEIPLKYLIPFAVISALVAALLVCSLYALPKEYVSKYDILAKAKHRIDNFMAAPQKPDPKTYKITNDNRQETYAKIAIANGSRGKFPGNGRQRDYLPLAYADYIYAIIIEEMGVAGGLFVMLLYVIILIRAGVIARKCEKLFPKYLILGCGLLIGIQAFINMAVVVEVFPIAGQPLPLISLGGSVTVVTCVYIGMMISASRFGTKDEDEDEIEEEETEEGYEDEETGSAQYETSPFPDDESPFPEEIYPHGKRTGAT